MIKRPRGRPRLDTEALNVRMSQEALRKIDAWIEHQPDPKPNRPEAVRRLTALGLMVHDSPAQPSRRKVTEKPDRHAE